MRPSKDVHIVSDLVRLEVEGSRTLWSTKVHDMLYLLTVAHTVIQLTNGGLQDKVAAFGTGLIRLASLQPQKSKVLLLLNDCLGRFIVIYSVCLC